MKEENFDYFKFWNAFASKMLIMMISRRILLHKTGSTHTYLWKLGLIAYNKFLIKYIHFLNLNVRLLLDLTAIL